MLDNIFLNNSIQDWIVFIITAFLVYFFIHTAKVVLERRLNRIAPATDNIWDDLVLALVQRISGLFLIVGAVYLGSLRLVLPKTVEDIIYKVFFIALLLQIGWLGSRVINFWMSQYRRKQLERNAEAVTTLSSVAFLFRVFLWVILALVALDNFGVNVTTLIAGLGVGGIAVALAVQNILGDLFASFSIVLDKPFVIGDFIIVGEFMGTVENVGLKTTRLRSLSGEQLIFSNTDLLASRIRNYRRMYERRVLFSIGVTYQTPAEKLEAIPGMIREIIENQNPVRFDRAHFKAYGAYSLDFEVAYYVLNPEYMVHADIQQAINLAIFRRFEEQGIDFAYPTQTLLMENRREIG